MAVTERIVRLAREFAYTFRSFPVARFSLSQLVDAASFFDEHGWVLIKGAFSTAEVDQFREDALASEREGLDVDLLSNPRLNRFILDERTVNIARALLGSKPTYFGDSDWSIYRSIPNSLGFHKDNADKSNGSAPDWGPKKYPILRMGIYLQDHADHSGGVALRDRSHHTNDCTVGHPFAAPTTKGDVIAWSLRTSHSGFASRMHVFPSAFLPMGIQGRIAARGARDLDRPRLLFRPLEQPVRAGLFASFGAESPLMQRFVRYLKTRRYAVARWHQAEYGEAVLREAEQKGLLVMLPPPELKSIDPLSVPEEHHELPADA